jgi:hydroxymethylglutaryl-CoA synthase
LAAPIELDQSQYEAIHDGRKMELAYDPSREFRISRVGKRYDAAFQDLGVEYYDYCA